MTTQAVRRRHVFFFSGFDPKGSAYYHRLYAAGAAQQRQATGHSIQVGPRERTDVRHAQRWQVEWQPGTAEQVHTTFEFLTWDDLVRAHWPKGILGVAVGSVLAYAAALSSGLALVRVWKQSRRTLLALAYPAVFWLLALAAVVDIAIHARPMAVSAKALAARHNLPPRHLENLLQALVRANILKGVRGPRGGYELARERRRITASEVLRAALADESADGSESAGSALLATVLEPMAQEFELRWLAELDGVTLADLCRKAEEAAVFGKPGEAADFTI